MANDAADRNTTFILLVIYQFTNISIPDLPYVRLMMGEGGGKGRRVRKIFHGILNIIHKYMEMPKIAGRAY